jgi:hypothetical protein
MLNKVNKRRGLHPRGNHDRGCDHRAFGGDRSARFLRARKRSQASRILNDLRMIDAAVDYAIETNRSTGLRWYRGLDELLEKGYEPLQHWQQSSGQCLQRPDR